MQKSYPLFELTLSFTCDNWASEELFLQDRPKRRS